MRSFLFLLSIVVLSSCNPDEKPAEAPETSSVERGELSEDSKIFLGNRLFSEKTCITCHSLDKEKIGPSVVEIMAIYNENDADIEAFLKGNSNPIADTSASQIAIMQANIDGFLKKITDEELNAIATYMQHVADLNK